ncbi:Hypothetical predicted protein [Mytilus galloprovincialis]|uniref:Mab-21-like HhH/H2TH-like domain-containing protein n=1 Tax=Mytilus galloprovincialis TaxID=29158 RepID=A0A8B6DY62_MYTGA|nr:Hypothetical predicted protein [Mytilus galloprovincialis]
MMIATHDNQEYNTGYVCITSGSFGEGLDMKGSDLDIMQKSKYIEVHENMSSDYYDKTCFPISMEDTKPGFTYLMLKYTKDDDTLEMCVYVRGKLYFSNIKFKKCFSGRGFLIKDHGPCLSDKYDVFDICYCLHSKSWITSANRWITRSNNSWPSVEVKQSIIDHGFLCVPIGVKGSENEEVEWRLSFSVGEKLLIYTFNHTMLLCYAVFKIVLRDVINKDIQCKNLLCSYFLKTIMFWVSEELLPSVWTPETLVPCFLRCFRRLIYCVEYSVCPHYFIPENNLFENKIHGHERQLLLSNLNVLYSYDWRCIFFSPQIIRCKLSPNPNINVIAHSVSLDRIVNSRTLALFENFTTVGVQKTVIQLTSDYVRSVFACLCLHSNRIKRIHLRYMSFICHKMSQTIQLTTRNGNKYQYKQYNTCLSYLLRNIHSDTVSGWLMLASFFYRRQQYDISLDLTLYALSKCTLEKLYHGKYLSRILFEQMSLKTFQKKGIMSLLKIVNVTFCNFIPDSSIVPTELVIGADTNFFETHDIPAVVYAHFLRVLCHHHLNNIRQCRECLIDLQLTISEGYFIPKDFVAMSTGAKANSYNCLGVAWQLLGKSENARQAFHKAIQMWPEPMFNAAFKRLS